MRIVAVVAAHPDDEVLGCGGTLAAHAAVGDRVFPLFLADGESARSGPQLLARIGARQEAAQAAARALGCEPPVFLGFADNQLDQKPLLAVVQALEAALLPLHPEVIYTHHGGDLNLDHRLCYQAVLTACRPLPDSPQRAIYSFEVPSSSEWGARAENAFQPNRFVDIANFLEIKRAAMACYTAELRPFPHPRSHEALAALTRWRGASAGVTAAEAFQVERELWLPGAST